MTHVPASSHGGGLPSQWSEGGHGDVVASVDTTNTDTLTVQGIANQNGYLLHVVSNDGAEFAIDGDGAGGIGTIGLGNSINCQLSMTPGGSTQIAAITTMIVRGPEIIFRLATAAPADGDLVASDFALWLDATPGATKLMIKAKDSGGTVRTASIALA